MSSEHSSDLSAAITELQRFSACDIADALLKLEPTPSSASTPPLAGFLADIHPQVPAARTQKLIAPAFTVLFHSKQSPPSNSSITPNIPSGAQWSDLISPSHIVIVSQPESQRCASVGGHHATRLHKLGASGLLVSGRIRDVADMSELGMGIWSRGTSIVGAGAETKPVATQVPVDVDGVTVEPGDLVMLDPAEGAVRIPKGLIATVLEFLPKHAEKEKRVEEMIAEGKTVAEAFEKGRK